MPHPPSVVNLAEALPERGRGRALERLPRYEIASAARRKPERVKESLVAFQRADENKVLIGMKTLPR